MKLWDKWLIVIPARMASSRLPEKPLADLAGRPLILRVFERIRPLTTQGARVVVATDHENIAAVCRQAGAPVCMTRIDHASGTDRCAEVAAASDRSFVLNVQGDEPFVNLDDLTRLMGHMEEVPARQIGTLAYRNHDDGDFLSPNVVKAVLAADGTALYFSRAPIPFRRDETGIAAGFWQHLGIYAYQKAALARFCALPPAELEKTEKLEQLRALAGGMAIHVVEARHPTIGIDTPEDLARAAVHYR